MNLPTDAHPTPSEEPSADVIVIGGGAAGLNGALMLARSRRRVLVIDSGTPRNAPAEGIHGLLGNEGTPPADYLERGRDEVRQYGGEIISGQVVSARAAHPAADGDLRFTVELADGRALTARRLLLATGVHDALPQIPGLAEHWGRAVLHCPFCHGWEVRDQPVGVIATASLHQTFLFRALTEDLTVFTSDGFEVSAEDRERCTALGIRLVETGIEGVTSHADGSLAGVRLQGGEVVSRSALVVSTVMSPRLEGLEDLGLSLEELPGGMGRKVTTGMAGMSEVPGVWVAGNAADPTAQVGASAASGALTAARLHGMLVMAEADAAVAGRRE
jgi:thioredoxin reductase